MHFLKHLSKSAFSMRFFRYCISGGATAIVFFGLIYLSVDYYVLPIHLSIVISALVAIPLNFFLHKIFSFRSSRNIPHSAIRYIVAATFSFMLNGLLLQVLLDIKIHYLIAQLISSPLLLIANYFILWLWVFSESAAGIKENI
jgi:putative flippase GtrA